MTNWADLIDTDPVGAWHAYELWKLNAPYAEFDNPAAIELEKERLLSNLAALCEALAWRVYVEDERFRKAMNPGAIGSLPFDQESIIRYEIEHSRNPDGSRRFPEMK